ncbi:MAG: metallophosphoesterase, partial [Clostridia bacterium]|nr:metallophosphoesterase [Clostridia bacterium]
MKKLPIILAIIIIIFFTFDNRLKIVDYNLSDDKISSDVKLALVTDLHSCLYGENQAKLINAIENYKPDAVLLGGDIF